MAPRHINGINWNDIFTVSSTPAVSGCATTIATEPTTDGVHANRVASYSRGVHAVMRDLIEDGLDSSINTMDLIGRDLREFTRFTEEEISLYLSGVSTHELALRRVREGDYREQGTIPLNTLVNNMLDEMFLAPLPLDNISLHTFNEWLAENNPDLLDQMRGVSVPPIYDESFYNVPLSRRATVRYEPYHSFDNDADEHLEDEEYIEENFDVPNDFVDEHAMRTHASTSPYLQRTLRATDFIEMLRTYCSRQNVNFSLVDSRRNGQQITFKIGRDTLFVLKTL